jgi:hypothetical protein
MITGKFSTTDIIVDQHSVSLKLTSLSIRQNLVYLHACACMKEREEGLCLVKNWLNAYIGSLYQEVNRLPENIQDFL